MQRGDFNKGNKSLQSGKENYVFRNKGKRNLQSIGEKMVEGTYG